VWRGLSCVKVAGRRRKSPQKKKKRAQRPTDHRMHLNWFIKAPWPPPHPPPPPAGPGSSSLPGTRVSPLRRPANTSASPRRAHTLPGHAVVASSCSRTSRDSHRPAATVGRPCRERNRTARSSRRGERVDRTHVRAHARARARTGGEYARRGGNDILLIAPSAVGTIGSRQGRESTRGSSTSDRRGDDCLGRANCRRSSRCLLALARGIAKI